MEQEQMNPQQPTQQEMPQNQQPAEPKKSAGLPLFIFAVIVLLVIALLWRNSQNSYEEEVTLPVQETVAPQTNEEISTELTTIEAELGELDSQTVVEAL
jgi:sensor domain CHASE-containing protein